jgi:hypothetical protein
MSGTRLFALLGECKALNFELAFQIARINDGGPAGT